MDVVVSIAIGYLAGSVPSADLIGRLFGFDIRNTGTGNPGTANALKVGGAKVAAAILLADVAKGVAAVVAGRVIGGDGSGLAAGAASIGGQVFNPWFRFRGGKGLGIAAGVTSVVWPIPLPGFIALIGVAAKALGSAARGALVALAVYPTAAAAWWAFEGPTAWGVASTGALFLFALWVTTLLAPKFLLDVTSLGRQ